MLITIITINFNNKVGLIKTMESVFNQTYKKFEYIVIDGASTDGSKELLERNEEKIDYWVSEPDKGIYNAMNKGIIQSSGEYIQFLNSGDYLYNKNVLKKVVNQLFDCDVLSGHMILLLSKTSFFLDKKPVDKVITLNTFITGSLNHPACFINTNLFKKYGLYDEELKIVSDWKFFLIALGLNNAKVKFMDFAITKFDVNGISNIKVDLRNSERDKVLNELIPEPIFKDYKKILNSKDEIISIRFRMLKKLENSQKAQRIISFLFKILLKIFKNKI